MQIRSLSGRLAGYNYIVGRDYETIQDRILRNTLIAVDYLHRTNALTVSYEVDGILNH